MYDLLIKNGNIVDGTGADGFRADLAIRDGRIAAIGTLAEGEAKQVIDASGCDVTPGFIDPHSHADMSMLVWQKNEAYTLQGVTTQICGNCGLAAAPIMGDSWEFWCWEYKCMNQVHKSLFVPYSFQTDSAAMKKALLESYGLDVNWTTLGEFMERAEKAGFSCNYYPLSGHNHIRNAVMGKEARPATPEELERMKAILRQELECGSNGFSTGLDYEPGRFAEFQEIRELLDVVAEYGGVYNTHVRGFDPQNPQERNMLYGVREATELCRQTGVKTNISHMSPLFTFQPGGSKEMEILTANASVAELEKGWREDGLPIMYDVIASHNMGGSTIPYLMHLVRPWVLMCGSVEAFFEKLSYPDFVEMMKEQAASGKSGLASDPMFNVVVVADCDVEAARGKKMGQIMDILGTKTKFEAMLELLKADPNTTMTLEIEGGEDAVRILLDSERAVPCSDGFAFDLDTEMDYPAPINRKPHPNNFCYAIRYLLNYGPERFEDKIRQMTSVPAAWFNIPDRGVLREGNWADVVIMRRDALCTNEDPVFSCTAPGGIDYVLINGVIAGDHQKHTGALAGKVLRRS